MAQGKNGVILSEAKDLSYLRDAHRIVRSLAPDRDDKSFV